MRLWRWWTERRAARKARAVLRAVDRLNGADWIRWPDRLGGGWVEMNSMQWMED